VDSNSFPSYAGVLATHYNVMNQYSLFQNVINPSEIEVRIFKATEVGPFFQGPAFNLQNSTYLFCLGINGNSSSVTLWNLSFTLHRIHLVNGIWEKTLIPEANYIYSRRFASFPYYNSHQYALIRIDDPSFYMVSIYHTVLPNDSCNVTLSFSLIS
jgi:hypothetical protein